MKIILIMLTIATNALAWQYTVTNNTDKYRTVNLQFDSCIENGKIDFASTNASAGLKPKESKTISKGWQGSCCITGLQVWTNNAWKYIFGPTLTKCWNDSFTINQSDL